MEHATRSVITEVYQKAFFNRVYIDAAPSVVDGTIARAVGNIKDDEWSDPWGARGVGHWIVKASLEHVVHQLEKKALEDCITSLQVKCPGKCDRRTSREK